MDVPVAALENARFVVLSLPYEMTTSYGQGTAQGPDAILDASRQVELLDEETQEQTHKAGIHTIYQPPLDFKKKPPEFLNDLTAYVKKMIRSDHWANSKSTLISLGGEHSISFGLVKAFQEKFRSNFSVLQLDAHSDLRDEYDGWKYGHASVARRIAEFCPITQVGVRSLSKKHNETVKELKTITTFLAHQTRPLDRYIPRVLDSLKQNVYITIDLDVFDPSVIPGLGTPEPGGLGWYDVLDLLRPVFQTKNVVGFDLVELSPIPGSTISQFAVARLAYRLMGYSWLKSKSEIQKSPPQNEAAAPKTVRGERSLPGKPDSKSKPPNTNPK